MGTTFLANTYQTANTAPNLIFELIAAGVLTSVFVPTFVEHIVHGRAREGWDAANALASAGLAALVGIAVLVALLAEPIMSLLTLGVEDPVLRAREVSLGATFLRLFAPQIVFYGLGMIMTAALHANRRFVLPAIAPIFNNIVVIGVYLAYASSRAGRPPTVEGITPGETLLLGAGTTAGVVAMTICLIPQLAKLGWKMRFTWSPSHPAVKKGVRLGVWALGYAGGYQAGLIVVLALANRIEGGVAAYQWAYTFFYLPHTLVGVPIFSVLFTAMAERAALDDPSGLADRLRDGLGMLAFILIPIAAGMFVLAAPLTAVVLDHGVMTAGDAALVGDVLAMFALGLPAYSAFLILTRAFYALGDTRVPAIVNAVSVALASAIGVVLFVALGDVGWEIPGLAIGHTLGFSVGAILLGRRLRNRVGRLGSSRLIATIVRSCTVSAISALAMAMVAFALAGPSASRQGVVLVGVTLLGACIYLGVMAIVRAPELTRIAAALRPSVR